MLLNKKNSIKRTLFVYLSSFIVLAIIAIGVTSFFSTKREIQKVFDANMIKSAKLLCGLVKHESKEKNNTKLHFELEEFSEKDSFHKYERKIHYQVWINNILVYNSNNEISLPKPDYKGFKDIEIEENKWRSFSFNQEKVTVIVLEEYQIRQELIKKILDYLLFSFAFSFVPITAIIWIVLDKKLQPIKNLSQKISDLTPENLKTFDDLNPPTEIKPFVDSLNSLLLRLAYSMESERRFTDYAAHELRTPIAVIKLQSQLLLRNKNKEKEQEYLNDLVAAVDRIDHLIGQILTLARLEPENKNIKQEDLNLKKIIESVINQNSIIANSNNDNILFEASSSPEIHANRVYLEIMLNNIIDNAIKYGEKNSDIKIILLQDSAKIFIEISNVGKSLSEEEQEKIFDKFYRIQGSDTIGCGLGLAISKKIVELSGGVISFKCKSGRNIVAIEFKKSDLGRTHL